MFTIPNWLAIFADYWLVLTCTGTLYTVLALRQYTVLGLGSSSPLRVGFGLKGFRVQGLIIQARWELLLCMLEGTTFTATKEPLHPKLSLKPSQQWTPCKRVIGSARAHVLSTAPWLSLDRTINRVSIYIHCKPNQPTDNTTSGGSRPNYILNPCQRSKRQQNTSKICTKREKYYKKAWGTMTWSHAFLMRAICLVLVSSQAWQQNGHSPASTIHHNPNPAHHSMCAHQV